MARASLESIIAEKSAGIDLLMPGGERLNDVPYTLRVVTERDDSFFGKANLLEKIKALVLGGGIAVIEGGHRSGRSSLLEVVADRLILDEIVVGKIILDFESMTATGKVGDKNSFVSRALPSKPGKIINTLSDIVRELSSLSDQSLPLVIVLDEIEGCKKKYQLELIELVAKLRNQGFKIVMTVVGDLNGGASQLELPVETKSKILKLFSGGVISNQLLTDEEVRQLLNRGGEPIFIDELIDYLVKEAGGHPLMANLLANEVLELLNDEEKLNLDNFRRAIIRYLVNYFDIVIDTILSAGYDPLTWKWNGQGRQSDVTVYQNMIPRSSSTIFQDWLQDYMFRLARKQTKPVS